MRRELQSMRRDRQRGFVYTLEVLLGVILITTTLVFVFRFSPPPASSELAIIRQSGQAALAYLDGTGDLRRWARDRNESALEQTLGILLSGVQYETEFCDSTCTAIGVPPGVSVAAVDHYVATYRDEFIGVKVRLWMWVA